MAHFLVFLTSDPALFSVPKTLVNIIHNTVQNEYSKSNYERGKVATPARGQLKRENDFSPVSIRA